jgi:hypothetical protein
MMSVREQYKRQCKLAASASALYGTTLDVVLVRHRDGSESRVSVLGNAISRAAYDIWREDSNVRLLCTYTNGMRDAKPVII